jgi:polygalacturonase
MGILYSFLHHHLNHLFKHTLLNQIRKLTPTRGVTKPKFFYAHNLISSSITGLTFKNSPVQLMSINGATTLAVTGITYDNSAGVSLGHNTDAFDVGSSTGVTITGANM